MTTEGMYCSFSEPPTSVLGGQEVAVVSHFCPFSQDLRCGNLLGALHPYTLSASLPRRLRGLMFPCKDSLHGHRTSAL